jgi:hypothetical protein
MREHSTADTAWRGNRAFSCLFASQSIGLFAFPKNSQTADQQLKDEADCYGAAKQRTGVDAQAPPPTALSDEEKKAAQQEPAENAPQVQGTRARGGARDDLAAF